MQERALRKWARFKILSGSQNVEPLASSPEGPITSEILVSVEELERFMWWLYLPNTDQSDERGLASYNCDLSFTYVQHLTNHLLTFIEEKGWEDVEMGLQVFRGDVKALREHAIAVMKKISM